MKYFYRLLWVLRETIHKGITSLRVLSKIWFRQIDIWDINCIVIRTKNKIVSFISSAVCKHFNCSVLYAGVFYK